MVTEIHSLRCENATNPLGIDVARPRLSWQLAGDQRGIAQTAYRIIVADSLAQLATNKGNIWDSKLVTSNESLWRHYKGPALQARQRYYWKVIVWDERNQRTQWSEPAFWEMGLLAEADWQADWITPDIEVDKEPMQPCPLLRTAFAAADDLVSARLYVTALGLYELQLNGRAVTSDCFTPGWTNYHKRLQYQTYDVTAQVSAGPNALGVMLGDGWYR
ncbi:MAG: alpha-L-rhamnosidase N-terminal domain-containing protein, partial [Anaerolineales bacterium]|nr:alpha-L-rhamnosidase N-terminal domain-containing protein [Anaerolineales bacterium]